MKPLSAVILFLSLCGIWLAALVSPMGARESSAVVATPVVPSGSDEDLEPERLDALLHQLSAASLEARRRGATRLLKLLTPALAERIVARMPELSPVLQRALLHILGTGGPWMTGIVRGLCGTPAAADHAAAILARALQNRPLKPIQPASWSPIALFPPGMAFRFPGTWPRTYRLDELLDEINFWMAPAFPFVLSPELDDGARSEWHVDRAPPSGPASMVVDWILMERGLGMEILETVTLVVPGGPRYREALLLDSDREDDRLVLARAIGVLRDPASSGTTRRSARRALATLDIPGLFDGALEELKGARPDGTLDYLLVAGATRRAALRLGVTTDVDAAVRLIEAFERQPPGAERWALIRLLTLLPGSLRDRALAGRAWTSPQTLLLFGSARDTPAAGAAEICGFLSDPDPKVRQGALAAARRRLANDASLREVLFEAMAALLADPSRAVRHRAERCLMVLGGLEGDERLSALLDRLQTCEDRRAWHNPGLWDAVASWGARGCLRKIVSALGDPLLWEVKSLQAYERICRRLAINPAVYIDALALAPLCRLASTMAFSASKQDRRAAFRELMCAAVAPVESRTKVLGAFAMAPADLLAEFLDPRFIELQGADGALPQALRRAVLSSALRSCRDDSSGVSVAGLRLALGRVLGQELDPLLDRALMNITRLEKKGTYILDVRLH